ncbi:Pleiotropic ABC efflux transporter of multiple drugs CDR1 [Seminavis robusta]|uniref:Pleiotropic ABC efflux transporter of multiple drugs CDR1 n=1 Tax=Seminavis robusta TaxID=568900 RepID=A0A9N8DVX0_9STRA|nr:Pleiotropic ABC efflux transporter of multiple drugs CDR1 [Seminavis robusta]|eukprot:Sro383_g131340.1 Pleiotropic ABC efflux transporter of multiple drugs CDR1 (1419) ;mRNA; r:42820-48347
MEVTEEEHKGAAEVEKLQECVRQLLNICAAEAVDIPEHLRNELQESIEGVSAVVAKYDPGYHILQEEIKHVSEDIESMAGENPLMVLMRKWLERVKAQFPGIDVRVKDGSYTVTNFIEQVADTGDAKGPKRAKQKIATVQTESPIYKLLKSLKLLVTTGKCGNPTIKETKAVMEGVNLALERGKLYLILGAPGCGKSTLLKMIAGTLQQDANHVVAGSVFVNGFEQAAKEVVWSNLASYIDQIDRLHARLTVKETLEFAWRCRSGGTHNKPYFGKDEEVKKAIAEADNELFFVNRIMDGLGLARVEDTFVGDQQSVRGVSGGEKKRVTVGEMFVLQTPVSCCDEISTGLDAATTYDIVKLIKFGGQVSQTCKIISLLQPPPEVVALFDETILLSEGRIIYCGPTTSIIDHFSSLGYSLPERVDVADWLQQLPTPDGAQFLTDSNATHLTSAEFKEKFDSSQLGMDIKERLEKPFLVDSQCEEEAKRELKRRYQNSAIGSLRLVIGRELLLWWRDKPAIQAKIMQDLIMGTVAGTLFWQADEPQSIMGILFQSMFFCSLGSMLMVGEQFFPRAIFYKHQDANLFPSWTFVIGRSLATIPNALCDGVIYGSLTYWFVGLAQPRDGGSVANYFIYLLLLFCISLSASLLFSVFSSVVRDRTIAQAAMAVSMVMLVLFSGFTVQPDVIPDYWIWVYWCNVFAWILRALCVNEFTSGKYSEQEGRNILLRFGMAHNGEPFTTEWIWYGVAFAIGTGLVATLLSVTFLSLVRFQTGKSLATDMGDAEEDVDEASLREDVAIPFTRVNLTFRGIRYTVTASTSREKLELLKGVDGVVEAGKMTALMGSSGAGKTTLMDVLSMRKSSGEIEGDVCLNGHPQEPRSFRRCTGYVEQFDVQSAQLTIRETVEFSARLRLEETVKEVTPRNIMRFVDQVLAMLELTPIQDLQVGDDLSGGLSFEQKKRLSIAVELVANPSIIFLDEPTSGLDARAASIVMKGLKRIAETGRAVVATIHQPSIAIFNSFDTLLLLKRGGEVVFFGDLGKDSVSLINYFERYSATTPIKPGENPATWMLTVIGAGSSAGTTRPFDYAGNYTGSKLHKECLDNIATLSSNPTDENKVSFPGLYATSMLTQSTQVLDRILKIYWRSPSYNLVRIMVAAVVALLFSSVYITSRVPKTESDMNSRATTIFIATIFLGVSAFNTVLAVFEAERNMYYRHSAALMYDQKALLMSFTFAELPFVMLVSCVFVVLFYFIMGFALDVEKFLFYYLFFVLAQMTFTYMGQMFSSLFRDSMTAQGAGGLFVSMTVMFTGVLIRPNEMPEFWRFMYYVTPGHYIYEGLLMTQFTDDTTPITASQGSPFYMSLVAQGCTPPGPCVGTAEEWVIVSFGDFSIDNVPWNLLYLLGLVFFTRFATYLALTHLNYRST